MRFIGYTASRAAIACLCLIALACSTEEQETTAAGPTWHGEVHEIVKQRCTSCHSADGIGPFRLDRPEDWETYGQAAMVSMDNGSMPPWLPDSSCGEFAHRGDMPKAEIDTVRKWLDGGRRPGAVPAQSAATENAPTFKATHSIPMSESYTPPPGESDTYRCFLMDFDTSEERYITGARVLPGANALVHHVLVYALTGDNAKSAVESDGKDGKPGYTCFGTPLPNTKGDGLSDLAAGFPIQLAAWVPGLSGTALPEGFAYRAPKGSRVVMQIHYNVVGGKTEADKSTLEFMVRDTAPERIMVTRPLPITNLNIPANQAEVPHEATYRYYGSGEVRVHGISPHMHLLGTKFDAEVMRADGSKECLLRIPKWDFAWQQSYLRPADNPLVLKSGDGIMMRCTYDNSAANQPLVGGKQLAPKKVTWGEGTLDEMCLLYMTMSEPFVAPQDENAEACSGYQSCSCDPSKSIDCLFSCDTIGRTCSTCAINSVIKCSGSNCGAKLLSAQKCLRSCITAGLMLNGSTGSCLSNECASQWDALRSCVDPVFEAGDCAGELAKCGIGD